MSRVEESASLKKFRSVGRKPLNLSQASLVRTSFLDPEQQFPLVMEPEVEALNLVAWAREARPLIEQQLLKHGGILFRGFKVDGVEGFEQFARAISPDLLDYRERAAPRFEVGNSIFTSTEYPADQHIPLHHEMSYSHNWPMKIWFFCAKPAEEGGATPIVNDRLIIDRLDPRIKEKFMEKKVMYVRNYGGGLDLSWENVFQTTDKAVVEEYCRKSLTQFEWRDGNRLRTRQVRQAVATHPVTGETMWFNHAHMFHVSNLEPSLRASLLAEFAEDDLPRNAYYGDGTPFEDSVLEEIRETYRQAAVVFPWQQDDILMLDNILASHGRHPYEGERKILVAMAELFTNQPIEVNTL
ncbi:MAG TPA: TauD/TfdA family dioxygenase [Pyrinomonadaceae bacterium]